MPAHKSTNEEGDIHGNADILQDLIQNSLVKPNQINYMQMPKKNKIIYVCIQTITCVIRYGVISISMTRNSKYKGDKDNVW